MNLLDDADFIITTDGGKVQSAGFTIFNRFLSNKVQPMYTINYKETTLDNRKTVSSMFEGLVVPVGVQVSPHKDDKNERTFSYDDSNENEDVLEEDLYDALFALKGVDQKEEPNSPTSKRKNTKKNMYSRQQGKKTKKRTMD